MKMMVNRLYDDVSQFLASCSSRGRKELLLTEALPSSMLLRPLHLFKFKHAWLMYQQTGAEMVLPNPEQAGGTCVSH